ncbi:late embryogenesis abundant protein 31-like [Lolium perenne]|uniref:late embryogenesis abundant protein 31-like n=1 Tax=Lolium perenne TaxID=4522 RepID=UPI003A99CAF9
MRCLREGSALPTDAVHGYLRQQLPTDATDTARFAAITKGITVTQTAVPGGRVVTEFIAGQVIGAARGGGRRGSHLHRGDVDARGGRVMPSGLADQAWVVASANAWAERDEDKITIDDVLTVHTLLRARHVHCMLIRSLRLAR